ncbi:MAG: hypothetical protein SPE31_00545 [Prevotella sp.]|nr:hypothetical protein [Prevotella sp.]
MDIHFRRQMICMTLFLTLSTFCCGDVRENETGRRAADVSGVGQGKQNVQPKNYNVMPQIVNLGRELVRINVQKNSVECSQNGGRSWVTRCSNASYGTFRDLLEYDGELLACTSKGLYVSTNGGRSFAQRCTNSSYGEFLNLQDGGSGLLANTTKGLYYSRNGGRSWVRR